MVQKGRKLPKITKKEMKQDEFALFVGRLIENVKEHKDKIYYITVGALAVALIVILVAYSMKSVSVKAYNNHLQGMSSYKKALSADPSEAEDAAYRKNFEEASEMFQKVVEEYSRTQYAPRSLQMLANCYFHMNELQKAIEAYNQFIEDYSEDEFIDAAYIGLAYSYEAQEQFVQALNALERLLALPPKYYPADRLYYDMGRLAELAEKVDKAEEYYQKALVAVDDESLKSVIENRLEELQPSDS